MVVVIDGPADGVGREFFDEIIDWGVRNEEGAFFHEGNGKGALETEFEIGRSEPNPGVACGDVDHGKWRRGVFAVKNAVHEFEGLKQGGAWEFNDHDAPCVSTLLGWWWLTLNNNETTVVGAWS